MSTSPETARDGRTGVIIGAVLVLVGAGLLWTAIVAADGDFSLQGPRLAPVVVSAAWVAIAALYLAVQVRPRPREQDAEEQPRPSWLVPLGVVACLAGFAIALEYAGFVVSAAVFLVVVARVLGSRHLIRDVIVAVVLPLAIYFAFTRLLDIFLPAGVFPL
jgi:putative tricarboxylic transport membrane protein